MLTFLVVVQQLIVCSSDAGLRRRTIRDLYKVLNVLPVDFDFISRGNLRQTLLQLVQMWCRHQPVSCWAPWNCQHPMSNCVSDASVIFKTQRSHLQWHQIIVEAFQFLPCSKYIFFLNNFHIQRISAYLNAYKISPFNVSFQYKRP